MAIFNMLLIVSLLAITTFVDAKIPGVFTGGQWESAHATFYGGSDASGTMGNYFPLSFEFSLAEDFLAAFPEKQTPQKKKSPIF